MRLISMLTILLGLFICSPAQNKEVDSPDSLSSKQISEECIQRSLKKWAGFRILAPEFKAELRIRGLIQFDGLYNDVQDQQANFKIRRGRIILDGKFDRNLIFRIQPQWSSGKVILQDAYIQLQVMENVSLRLGKMKTPLGIERSRSASAIGMPERGFSSSLVPNRDIGVQIRGNFGSEFFHYNLGVGTGTQDQGCPDENSDDNLDFYGKFSSKPFSASNNDLLEIGIAGSWGKEEGSEDQSNLGSYRTGYRNEFGVYADGVYADGVYADGYRWRMNPYFRLNWNSLGLISEYVHTNNEISKDSKEFSIANSAWMTELSYVITQEKASFKGINPEHSWGAVELVARYCELTFDDEIEKVMLPGTPELARSYGLSLNYWASALMRAQLAYEQTDFKFSEYHESDNAVYFRLQVAF